MSIECSCIHCKKVYSNKGIHTHYERNHASAEVKAKYPSGNNGKYAEISAKIAESRNKEILEYNKNPKICIECGNEIDYDHKDSTSNCCSASCAAKLGNRKRNESGWILSNESRDMIRSSLSKHREINGISNKPLTPKLVCNCANCGIQFETRRPQQCCSRKCASKFKYKKLEETRTPFANYRKKCAFDFDLKQYPAKFDFSLIEKHGWYSASNRGDNLNGVSRDHMISVRYGFDNNIDPKLISHPANCELLQHNKNSAKHSKCSITLNELLERIHNWDN